jgi:hypothetical protein
VAVSEYVGIGLVAAECDIAKSATQQATGAGDAPAAFPQWLRLSPASLQGTIYQWQDEPN